VTFTLAHFSDLHLGPLPRGAVLRDFKMKRVIGAASWAFNRRSKHRVHVADALRSDILLSKPDHISFTGDGTNIASAAEFRRLKGWIEHCGGPDFISYTPGNHDAYVPIAWHAGLGLLDPFMTSDMKQEHAFPFVRLRRNIALIGLNSAEPRGFHSAEGTLGENQLQQLAARLEELRHKGFYRLVMIHHPPAPGLAAKLRGLTDAVKLKTLLCREKVELVIHGHNHVRSFNWIEDAGNRVPVIGVASASLEEKQHHPAEWNAYAISRNKGQWQTLVKIRQWRGIAKRFEAAAEFEVVAP
jgi:3',5'-cyclic AMP phosphodiesterase CpdA